MQLQRFIDALKADLTAVAELGDESTATAAGRLVVTLQASVGLRLLDALSEAALELNDKLPAGHVEVRLTGQDPELVYVSDEPEAPAAAADEAYTARITLRLPENLKGEVEKAAAREGVSVNTYIVRALSRSSTSAPSQQSGNRLTGYARG
ncbi:MAG TPA: toxin-antitoxin system HicB family antitoxin [Gaiellaceae bacterium]|jgi:HicB-like protein involved in pilus formation|nr:toxin-antitoxin system HicB family antitoxin [Gaiellaceae bacterium]